MQKIRPGFITLFVLLFFFLGWSPTVFAVNATTSRLVQTTFAITTVTPNGASIAALTAPIRATFNAAVNMDTINLQTFVVQSNVRGRLSGAFAYDINTSTVTFTPARPFVQGEIIIVIATGAITSNTAATLVPYQWRFTAGHIEQRCIESFVSYADDFTSVWSSTAAWGDYDNDGDLDALVAGQTSGNRVTFLYRNEGGNQFSQLAIGLPGIREGSVAWGDYDNDGDLDILLAGESSTAPITRVYRNDGNSSFTNSNVILPGIWLGEATWSDYNNDGYLDILITGQNNNTSITQLYRNNHQGGFVAVTVPFVGVNNGAADWGDYDNDGDLDLLLTGEAGTAQSIIYRNDGNDTFVNINATLTGVRDSAVAWGDYNGDGYADILLTGNTAAFVATTLVYRNQGGGAFTDSGATLTGVSDGAVAWGDYDNDGDADILLNGKGISEESTTQIYRNDNGSFTLAPFTLPAVSLGSTGWGDYDNDLDLDILLTGLADDRIVTGVYENRACPSDVAITKQATPTLVVTSQPVTFTVTFINHGPVTATSVIITDILPSALANVQVVSTTSSAGITLIDNGANPPLGWNVSNLPIQQGGTITITGELTPEPGAVYTNTARISAAGDVTFANNIATATIMAPFRITQTSPQGDGIVSATPDDSIQATFEASINPATVNGTTLKVVGSQSGYLDLVNPSYDAGSRTYSFQTNRLWNIGETISAIGTDDVKSAAGAPLLPYQWQFVAGRYVEDRCIAEFKPLATALPALTRSAVAWGDYDKDGDLDVAVVGSPDGSDRQSKLYRNDGNGLFTDSGATLVAIYDGAASWGDYDKDGNLDLLLTGSSQSGPTTRLYRNDNGLLSEAPVAFPGLSNSSVAWGDYDNDGDLDIALAGTADGSNGATLIYRNDGSGFTNSNIALTGIYRGEVAWGDGDGDGDLDLLVTGTTNGSTGIAHLYRNDGGSFVNLSLSLPGLYDSDAAWGDYDSDGDLDFILMGTSDGTTGITTLMRNDGGNIFAGVTTGLPALSHGSVAWGDYENDGDLDLLLTGTANGTTPISRIFINQGVQGFSDAGLPLVNSFNGDATWHDYDGDGDLDLLLAGSTEGGALTQLYRSIDCVSDLALTNTVNPDSVSPGQFITYTLTFSNLGPQPATHIVLTDVLPLDKLSDLQINSTHPITQIGPPYIWQMADIAPGAGGVITIVGRTSFLATGVVITNTAIIRAREDVTATNDVATTLLTVRAPQANFATATSTIDEQNGQATVTVTLNEPNVAGAVSLAYQSTTQGTAQAGSDYTAVNGVMTIPSGATLATFTVPLQDDTLDEDNETVLLSLSNPVGAVLGGTTAMTLTIVDNDAEPTLNIADVTVNENAGSAVFALTLSVPSGRAVSITASTVDGTATAPADYTALSNIVITMPAGQTAATITVEIRDDNRKEESEQFFVNLTAPLNVGLPDNQAIGVIVDNDDFGVFLPIVWR